VVPLLVRVVVVRGDDLTDVGGFECAERKAADVDDVSIPQARAVPDLPRQHGELVRRGEHGDVQLWIRHDPREWDVVPPVRVGFVLDDVQLLADTPAAGGHVLRGMIVIGDDGPISDVLVGEQQGPAATTAVSKRGAVRHDLRALVHEVPVDAVGGAFVGGGGADAKGIGRELRL
jgi:hypothetical protein